MRYIYPFLQEIYHERRFLSLPNHGVAHSNRVAAIGHYLCTINKEKGFVVEEDVVIWFAYLHDICRVSDSKDEMHPSKGYAYVNMIRDTWLRHLSDHQFFLLSEAILNHHKIIKYGELTIDTCFDADRLDVARFGVCVSLNRLATDEAKQFYLSHNGRYEDYCLVALRDFSRLKFNDSYYKMTSNASVAIRANIVVGGKSYSPYINAEWDIESKSVTPAYDTIKSGIYAYPYPNISEIKHLCENVEQIYTKIFDIEYFQLIVLQYDEYCLIGKRSNSICRNYGFELVLSKANIMGTCRVSKEIDSDIDNIIRQYRAEKECTLAVDRLIGCR